MKMKMKTFKHFIGNTFRILKLPLFSSLIPSIIVCFRYLPFKQAIKLPILVYKAKLREFGIRIA